MASSEVRGSLHLQRKHFSTSMQPQPRQKLLEPRLVPGYESEHRVARRGARAGSPRFQSLDRARNPGFADVPPTRVTKGRSQH
eukprot:CAMPEP_0197712006 /NCGR_PEP_ID=MMETSP1338-20131121/129740_1 /TAXON_ID=43686 ORGANISM="Pelagodinium beii, Strain RCC1491" /NCGR_SAMPLE_ID=MMETSP1338 /ASSEMBLY_ACC=CAM_ASM_000754 /LENGTH=82 /DNA_ID=CAMNT_0043295941 /DNA_START=170 /DNA_END=418 /DNA_ORIENTATION=-